MRLPMLIVGSLLLTGCWPTVPFDQLQPEERCFADLDGDGFGGDTPLACEGGGVVAVGDCDDDDPERNPDAFEDCNELDDNCDGDVDESVPGTWFFDEDEDGFGDPDSPAGGCIPGASLSADATDCDDEVAAVNPDADEICNEIDDDCDDLTDEEGGTWYADTDGDGFGDPDTVSTACEQPSGYIADATDCDDSDGAVHPGALESSNGVDDDCNGTVDDVIGNTCFVDGDGDGFGSGTTAAVDCSASGLSDVDGDCDDARSTIFPGADETCNGADDDCDGTIDDNPIDPADWYADVDEDGAGAGPPTAACDAPAGSWSTDDTDCDDANATIFPGAAELCDGLDNDCDGDFDETAPLWHLDEDGDGFGGDALVIDGCDAPGPDWVSNQDDCDDTLSSVNPDANERCNGIDDDCDGTVDLNPTNPTWWTDIDGDSFGDAGWPADSCAPGAGYVQNQADCDDANADANPLADETCADIGVDNDCDGDAAEEGSGGTVWYLDGDIDGFGDPSSLSAPACTAPSAHVANAGDCNDDNEDQNPDATEVCNSFDDDCDGVVDTDAVDRTDFFTDSDGDGYGDASSTVQACQEGPGIVADNTDCDDSEPSINPGADEVCNGEDTDCNGSVDDNAQPATWYRDVDGDNYGDNSDTQVSCNQPGGYVLNAGDCDDSDDAVNPSEDELCATPWDDDCDGQLNESDAPDTSNFYVDSDDDGYGQQGSVATAACSAPTGFVSSSDDCDDSSNAINPGATELCATAGVDDDCDGQADEPSAADAALWYPDLDDDGYGDEGSSGTTKCTPSSIEVSDRTDCNDGDVSVNPGADELCATAGIDDDCSGAADDGSPADANTYYNDGDDDGIGDAADGTTDACSKPSGFSGIDGDCDNTDASVYPGAPAACDDVSDLNCDGAVDNDADDDGYSDESCGGSDCDDADASINPGAANCFGFAYAPANVDPDDYTPDGPMVMSCSTGDPAFDTDSLTYNAEWQGCADTPTAQLVTLPTGQQAALLAVDSLDGVADVRFTGSRPIIILVYGDAQLSGNLYLSAEGSLDGGGGGGSGPHCSFGGGDDGSSDSSGGGGGGGGGGKHNGGNGGTGSGASGGDGGNPLAASTPPPLRGGCRGGDGLPGQANGGSGGGGGGAIQISVAGDFDASMAIYVTGGGGGGGERRAGGGGGGSGGTVVLQAQSMGVFEEILTTGGSGGGAGGPTAQPGEDGYDGNWDDPVPTANGSSGGGNGGAAGTATPPGPGWQGIAGGGGGGGGGSAGFIHVEAVEPCLIHSNMVPMPTGNCTFSR